MKKISIIILFLLPIIVFTMLSISGIITNDSKYVKAEEVEITADKLIVNEETGEKYIVVSSLSQIQLGYNMSPEDVTEKEVIWEIVTGEEYAEINKFGVVTIKKLGGDVIVRVFDLNRTVFDSVKILVREK